MIDPSTRLNLRDMPFRIAFGVEGYLDKELKDDETYIKTYTRMLYQSDGKTGEKMIPHRRCLPSDFDEFSPVESTDKDMLKEFKDGKRSLFCPDWDKVGDDVEIWGNFYLEQNYQSFEYIVTPCNYIH